MQAAGASNRPISLQPVGQWCGRAVCGVAALVDSHAIHCAPRLASHPAHTAAQLLGDRQHVLTPALRPRWQEWPWPLQPPTPLGDTHGSEEDSDDLRRLLRGLRNHGALPGAAGCGPPGARCLPRQGRGRVHPYGHPRLRGCADLQREAGPPLHAERQLRRPAGGRLRRARHPRRPRPRVPAQRPGRDRRRAPFLRHGRARGRRLPRRAAAGRRGRAAGPHLLGLSGLPPRG